MYKLLFGGLLLMTGAAYGQLHDLVNRIVPPQVKTKVAPEYTDRAAAAGLKGTVVLRITVDRSGIPRDAQFVAFIDSRDPSKPKSQSEALGLDESAIAAVRKWRFTPAIKNMDPVAVEATVELNFQGPEHSPPERFREHQL